MGLECSGEDEGRKRKEGALKKAACIYSWEGRLLPSTPWISELLCLSSFHLSTFLPSSFQLTICTALKLQLAEFVELPHPISCNHGSAYHTGANEYCEC